VIHSELHVKFHTRLLLLRGEGVGKPGKCKEDTTMGPLSPLDTWRLSQCAKAAAVALHIMEDHTILMPQHTINLASKVR
jgi:hypothetical protein